MAGGGFKASITFGETHEFGTNAILNPLTVHDLHATILHQLGLDHERLTYYYGGRDYLLTDVHGDAMKEILTQPFEELCPHGCNQNLSALGSAT